MAFCTECGARLSDGAKFCANCGTAVAASHASDEIIDSFKQDRVIGIINICVIILSLLNFIIFKVTGNLSGRTYKTVKRQTQFKHNINKGIKSNKNLTAIHRCCVCGKTNLDDPDLEFRYCSKCSGNKEYCMEHLFKHEHK